MVFALNLPKLTLSGEGAVTEAVEVLTQQTVKKALIVTDKNLIDLGILDSLYAALDAKDFNYVVFDKVTPNPTTTKEGICFVAFQSPYSNSRPSPLAVPHSPRTLPPLPSPRCRQPANTPSVSPRC